MTCLVICEVDCTENKTGFKDKKYDKPILIKHNHYITFFTFIIVVLGIKCLILRLPI